MRRFCANVHDSYNTPIYLESDGHRASCREVVVGSPRAIWERIYSISRILCPPALHVLLLLLLLLLLRVEGDPLYLN